MLLTISALLSGCSGGEKASSDGKVTLNFWSAISPGTEEERKTNELIKKFEKEHPNIIIKTQVITYDMLHDKLVVAISANDAPDLSWGLSEWFGELNQMGALQDLTPISTNGKIKMKYIPML